MIIALDMDEVLVEINPPIIEEIHRQTAKRIRYSDLKVYSYEKAVPEVAHIAREVIAWPDLYDNLPPMTGALEGVAQLLDQGHRIIVVSTPHHGHAGSKLRWLDRHGFFPDDVYLCGDKSLIDADVLVDDRMSHLEAFVGRDLNRLGIVFDRPWNRGPLANCRITRVLGWDQIPQLISTQ